MKKLIASCVALAMLLSFSGCEIKQSAESIPNSSGETTSEASTDTIPETIAPDGIDESTEIDGVMSYEKNIETESEKNRSTSKTPYTSLSEHTLTAKTKFGSIYPAGRYPRTMTCSDNTFSANGMLPTALSLLTILKTSLECSSTFIISKNFIN